MNTSTNRLEEIKRIGSCAGSGAALFCVRREPEPGLLTYCPKVDTKIQKILLGATFRVVLTPLSRHGTIIKIICERVNCAMDPSAKACPAAIKPTVQCFFPTLYQVLLFDFSSFGEKLFFCLRGYRRAIAQNAVQKQPERRARMFLCSPAAEQAANGWREQPSPTTNRLSPRNRAKRGAKTAGAQSAAPAGAFRSATAAGGTWRGDRMFLCSPAAEQAANGWR